jgi:hypothetical protein
MIVVSGRPVLADGRIGWSAIGPQRLQIVTSNPVINARRRQYLVRVRSL